MTWAEPERGRDEENDDAESTKEGGAFASRHDRPADPRRYQHGAGLDGDEPR